MPQRPTSPPFTAPASQSEHGWEVRTQILRAAQEVARSRGHAALRIRDVATAARVSPALVIRHFPTKSDLLLTLFIEHAEGWAERLRASGDAKTPRERAVGFVEATFERDLSVADLAAEIMAYSWTWSAGHERWLRFYEDIYVDRMIALLAPLSDESTRRIAAKVIWTAYVRELRRAIHARHDAKTAMQGLEDDVDFAFKALG